MFAHPRASVLLAFAALPCVSPLLPAQDYVTTTWVYLRRSPSMTGDRLRTLASGDSLLAREVDPRPGWLPVRTMDGKAGWVGEIYLRSLAAIAASNSAALVTAPGGGAFTEIDPSWSRGAVLESTIWMASSGVNCGPRGDAVDDGTNYNKNRADIPASSHLVTIDAIRSLPDTALWRFTNRKNWTAADSALVIPYEGLPLTVEGYFEIVKPQKTSAPSGSGNVGESPNCHSWAEGDTDWHIALVGDPSETEEESVVIEPTPRSKRNNPGWIPATAAAIAVRRSPSAARDEANASRVRVTGFLMLDPVHPSHIEGKCTSNCANRKFFRATLWELHPVTKIEVWIDGEWVDLNEVTVP